MRSKVTVVLLFLNVVLFSYIYFYDLPRIRDLKTMETRRRVLGPEAATIESLTRKHRTGETLRLEKRTDAWWLTAPYEWPADRNAIAGLLNTLELLEHETSFPVADLNASGRSLADYGLADPTYTVEFKSAGQAEPYTLLIGDTTEVGNRLYVLSPDKTRVHVVNRSLAEAIGLPLETLRSPSIFSVPVFEVRSLNVQTAGASTATTPRANLKVRLRRDAANRWAFEAPITARASKTAVEVTINAVNALTTRSFLEPRDTDLERAGLNAPSLQITLEGNARRETLLLGNPTGAPVNPAAGTNPGPATAGNGTGSTEYFAKIDDKAVVFTTVVPKELLDVLNAAQEELRDARVVDLDPATVTAFTITAPGQPELSLQRLEPIIPAADAPATDPEPKVGWQAVVRVSGAAPQTLAADPDIIDNPTAKAGSQGVLQKIAQLAAHEARAGAPKFLSDAPAATDLENWGFNRPEREITLQIRNPATKETSTLTLQIGVSPDKPGEAFARTTNAPFVYQVLPDILDDTPATARSYRLRVLRELPKEARITSLKLSALPGNTLLLNLSNENAITAESLATAVMGDPTAPVAAGAAPATKPMPERARAVLVSLLGQLRELRAKAFPAGSFTPDHAETPAGPQPWKYQLEVVTAYATGNAPAQNTTLTLLFTDRLGGSTMLAGTDNFGGVLFEVTQEMLDAIFALTYTEKHDPGLPAAPKDPAPAEPAAPAPKTETATPGKS